MFVMVYLDFLSLDPIDCMNESKGVFSFRAEFKSHEPDYEAREKDIDGCYKKLISLVYGVGLHGSFPIDGFFVKKVSAKEYDVANKADFDGEKLQFFAKETGLHALVKNFFHAFFKTNPTDKSNMLFSLEHYPAYLAALEVVGKDKSSLMLQTSLHMINPDIPYNYLDLLKKYAIL